MGFLNALGQVSRRTRWRRTLVFYDFATDTFHDITDATLSLGLFRVDPRSRHRESVDEGCCTLAWAPFGSAFVTSDDGNGYLLPDGANRGKLDVPAALVSTVPRGLYRASVVATYPDGSSVEVLSESVVFTGTALPPPPLKPFLTADAGIAVDVADPVSGAASNDLGVISDMPLTADSGSSVDVPFANNGQPAGSPPIPAPLT